ncbi:MAG: LysM peptidoglycan-binding domain-containing protein [Chloroflexota bacterium]|nr:LysM peptidoglycan-binding domain-containing protein [Chloroflexota bacterium]
MKINERGGLKIWRIDLVLAVLLGGILLTACQPQPPAPPLTPQPTPTPVPVVSPTPLPERLVYSPGQLVEYTAQTGDTLPVLAFRFNTTVEEIREVNSVIPNDATTLPPGLPMQIPIYYEPFWGTPFKILPNSLFVNGPAQTDFDTSAFIASQPGWLKSYEQYAGNEQRTGAEIVDYIATNFSVSPRFLLAVLEYQLESLSNPVPPPDLDLYPLGYEERTHTGLYMQLVWATNTLNNGYYGWLTGHIDTLEHPDSTIEHPDPWQNAGSVALQYYFSLLLPNDAYHKAIGPNGFAQTYRQLFGDPWLTPPHIPGSLRQPEMVLPFEQGRTWSLTGGPHTGWGMGDPWAALDFAPPGVSGCGRSKAWAAAVASGVVTRSETGIVELDLDGDGNPRTGWVIFYLHIATQGRIPLGAEVEAGEPIGFPSCEGGTSTGTHLHIVRKYNGEWMPADGVIPFNLEGWIAHNGINAYSGTLTRFSRVIIANDKSGGVSHITAGE